MCPAVSIVEGKCQASSAQNRRKLASGTESKAYQDREIEHSHTYRLAR